MIRLMLFLTFLLILIGLPWSLFFCLKVIKEYQRAVIFRLGRLIDGGTRGPGVFLVLPCIDTYKIVGESEENTQPLICRSIFACSLSMCLPRKF